MKALVVTPDFPPELGGIQTLSYRVAHHLARWKARVVALGSQDADEFDRTAGVDTVRAWSPRWSHAAAIGALNAAVLWEAERFRPDVVLSMHIVLAPATAIIGLILQIPVLQYVHGNELAGRRRLARVALRRADRVVAVSAHTERLAVAGGADPSRIVRIPPGVEIPARREERSERPLVVTIARLDHPYKGHDVIARAMPLVLARVPDVKWIVVGDGPLRPYLERLAQSHELDGHVHFVGAVSNVERDVWLDRAHVFAMPSRLPRRAPGGEGFGIVYLEAGAHGVPVVAGNVAGALDAVIDGVTGLLVNPEDHVTVADAISALLTDPERASRMGAAGAARAAEYTWPEIAARVEGVLDEVAGR